MANTTGWRITLASALCIAHWLLPSHAGAAPTLLEFRGICDASAAVALDENRIIVADDEVPVLSIYRLDTQELLATLPLDRTEEADIEAATIVADRIVWLTSHGRNKNGKPRPERAQLFPSHRLSAAGWTAVPQTSFTGLIAAINARKDAAFTPLHDAIGNLDLPVAKLAPKREGFNIEGMAATPDGKSILVGLRNPQRDGDALLFPVEDISALLDTPGAEAHLGEIIALKLGARGIRDIAWSEVHNAYFIAAGQVDDETPGAGFAIYKWRANNDKRPAQLRDFTDPTQIHDFDDVLAANRDFHPEAIVPLLEQRDGKLTASRRVLLISDDGTRKLPGRDCQRDADAGQKSFRAVIRTLD
jgi:hypothetical protein